MDKLSANFSTRSSSEVVPDIRNGMKIFSPVSGWMMACVQRALASSSCCRERTGLNVWECSELTYDWSVTYLLDLLCVPQLHGFAVKFKKKNYSQTFFFFNRDYWPFCSGKEFVYPTVTVDFVMFSSPSYLIKMHFRNRCSHMTATHCTHLKIRHSRWKRAAFIIIQEFDAFFQSLLHWKKKGIVSLRMY